MAAEQRGLHRRGAGIRHVDEPDARRGLLEVQLQQVVVGADAGGAERHRLGRPPRRRQQVLQAAIGGVGGHPEAARVVDDVGDVAEVRHAVPDPPLDGDGHQGGRGDGAERVAVRAGVEGDLGADLPARPGAVVNHELRPGQVPFYMGQQQPRHLVHSAAGWEGHHHLDRPVGGQSAADVDRAPITHANAAAVAANDRRVVCMAFSHFHWSSAPPRAAGHGHARAASLARRTRASLERSPRRAGPRAEPAALRTVDHYRGANAR